MMNYYEELGINSNLNLAEIQKELTNQEALWTRRQVNNPEKATEKLALINQARKVFSSDASRREYDNELERSKANRETLSPEKIAEQEKQKWHKQAQIYYSEQQYDLAKAAIEKALSLSNTNSYDDTIFALAAEIYRECGHLDLALDYVNKAIVLAPDLSEYYLIKALIFDRKAIEASAQYQIQKVNDYYNQARNQCQIAINKADNSGDSSTKAKACGILAFVYYYKNPIDKSKAEQYALMAQRYGGDPWGNAQKVLEDINLIKEEKEKEQRRKEEERKRKEYNEARELAKSDDVKVLEYAIEKFKRLNGFADSQTQIQNCQNRIEEINNRAAEEERIKEKNRLAKKKAVKIFSVVAIACVLIAITVTAIITIINNANNRKIEKEHYINAVSLIENNQTIEAAIEYGKAGSFEDAKEQSFTLWRTLLKPKTIDLGCFTGNNHIVAIKNDGTVVATGSKYDGQCDVEKWTDIISVATGMEATYGLKSDGTIVATGKFDSSILNWKDIVYLDAGDRFVAGLKSDGTVVLGAEIGYTSIDKERSWKEIVTRWEKITSIWCGGSCLVARTIDDKYKVIGDETNIIPQDWTKIIQIDQDNSELSFVGLKEDGTVYATGDNSDGQLDITGWTNIVSISSGIRSTVGLKSDGTVLFTGKSEYGESAAQEWDNIVAIDADCFQVVGVKANGTALLVGEDAEKSWFKEVSEWDDLMIPQQ